MKTTQRTITVLILAATIVPHYVRAELEIELSGQACSVNIRDDITAADAGKLERSDCPRPIVWLNDSPGGDVSAGMKIGRWVRKHQAATVVGKDQRCYSTCALVFIAGVERINTGIVGLHRPYLSGAPQPEESIPALVSTIREEVRAYISEMGARSEFTSVMLETLPEQMRLYREDDIHELVAEKDAVYDEIEVSRNAQLYGLSTDDYRRRSHDAEQKCDLNRFNYPGGGIAWDNCRRAVLWGLSQSIYLRRNESVPARCGYLAADANKRAELREQEVRECRIIVMRGQ